MNSGVCVITNNHNKTRKIPEISWEWIYVIDKNKFSLEWTFSLNDQVEKYIWVISFEINDIVYGNNNDILLFSYLFDYKPLWEDKKKFNWLKRDIFYLKLKTWLNEEEERFIRYYYRLQNWSRQKYEGRFLEIQDKIQKHITEERERVMHLLNDKKWHWGDLELF